MTNGGILRRTPIGSRRSKIVNPLSTMITSPWEKGKLSNPDLTVNSLSELLPAKSWEINVMWPLGAMPISALNVV